MKLMTATLLNSWQYYLNSEYASLDSFLKTLNRDYSETTEAQEVGNNFEAWAVENYTPTLKGCYQVKAYRNYKDYLLYGKIDCLKAGTVYDYKYTSNYTAGNYFNKPQTSMYLSLVPEAQKFIYVISTDKKDWCEENILTETYTRDEVKPIELIINEFEEWLKGVGLSEIYQNEWECK